MPQIEKPQLIIEIIDSKEMETKEPIIIFPRGCLSSERNVKDGITIFGTFKDKMQTSSDKINISTCDIVIPSEEYGFGQKHFAIFFNIETNEYYIVDLYQGTGTFILVNKPLRIKSNHIISFGNSHISFLVSQNDDIEIKFVSGQLKGSIYQFKTKDYNIKIGRHAKSDIRVNENGLSRTQCQLIYTSQG